MADVTPELIYEVLKQIQTRLGGLEDGQRAIREELQAMRGHQLSTQTDIHNIYVRLDSLEAWSRRVEKRLELTPAE